MFDRILKTFFCKRETKSDILSVTKRREKAVGQFTPIREKRDDLDLITAAVKRRFA